MKLSQKLFFGFFISQICFLGVFGLEKNQYYVVEKQSNLCGLFTRGNSTSPNWLPESWIGVTLERDLTKIFSSNPDCVGGNISTCCSESGWKYAGVAIGQKNISPERSAAEFLGSMQIINSQSLAPSNYFLSNNITRKEIMKVIMNASGKKVGTDCKEIFSDVSNDWGCKYIESALENNFIVGKQAFRPEENITKVEALKLIFQARDIKKRYETQYWQEDYISSAYYLGYIDEKFKDYNSAATRGWIFEILARSYEAYIY